MENKFKIVFTVLVWVAVAAGIAALWYCFGGYLYWINKAIPIPEGDGPEGEGLGRAVAQIFLMLVGVGVVPFELCEVIGAVGHSAFLRNPKKGFVIAAITPALVLALLNVVILILSTEFLTAQIILGVCAAVQIAVFVTGILFISALKKARAAQK